MLGVLFAVGVASLFLYQDMFQSRVLESALLHDAARYSRAITEFRTLYTAKVVEVVRPHGIEVTHDVEGKDNAIPLPWTLSIELGNQITEKESGSHVRLYSPYPFPWRSETGGLQDDFAQDAWNFFQHNPDTSFYRFEEFDERPSLRFATADLMRPSCVNCHNTHPESPKTDWKVWDVRGVLEVMIPINTFIAERRSGLLRTFILIGGMIFLGMATLVLVKSRLRLEEKQLLYQEEKYRTIFEESKEVIYISTQAGKFIDINQAGLDLFGYSKKEIFEIKVEDFYANPYDRKLFKREIEKNGSVRDFEIKFKKKDGTVLECIEFSTVRKSLEGEVLGYQGIIQDITERKEIQNELIEREKKFKTLLEMMPMGVRVAIDGNIVFLNQELANILGYEKEELLNTQNIDFIHPDDREWAIECTEKMIKDRGGHPEKYRMIRKDGTPFPAEVYSRKFEYDGKPALLCLIRDITEHQKLSAELDDTLSTLKLILDTTYDGIFVIDNEQMPVYYNDKFLDMVEISKDPMTKSNFKKRIKSIYHLLKDPHAYKKRVKYFIENPEEEGYDVLEFKNGKVYERHTTPQKADGKIIGRIWSFNNITNARIEESKREKVEKKLQTAERMESLGVLAGGVAHDLNNVLGMIQAYPDLILEDLPEDTPVKNDLLDMKQAATDAAQIISDLLAMARRGRYRMEPLNLNEIVLSYLKSPSFKALKSNNKWIKLELDLAEQIKETEGSRIHLYKVIMNLVQNAFEAIPRSGNVSIRLHSDRVKAQSSLFEELIEGEYVILKIRDSGGGVSEEDISHIFEPFYSKKKMGISGSGLGLSVVWSVVKDHGGFINIETSENEGTEFTLYFPVTEKTKKSPVKKLKTVGGNESILVVDDEARQRKIANKVLTSLGYDVTMAVNGKETLSFLRSNDVDLIILDMIMKDEDAGLEVFKKIIEFKPTQKAIIVSGFSESEYVKEAKKLGVGKFIMKPYTKYILGNAVREELDRV